MANRVFLRLGGMLAGWADKAGWANEAGWRQTLMQTARRADNTRGIAACIGIRRHATLVSQNCWSYGYFMVMMMLMVTTCGNGWASAAGLDG